MNKTQIVERHMADAMEMYADVNAMGGFSRNQNMQAPSTGYMVGGICQELNVNADDLNESMFAIMYMCSLLTIFIASMRHVYDKIYVGGWIDADNGGKLCLDISEQYDDLDVAMQVARNRNQRYIFDVANQESIKVEQ
jgi:hypothetical protein